MTLDSSSVISQLTHAISTQNKEVELNRLCLEQIKCTITRDEAKKDRTNKIHASILKMIKMINHASAKSSSDNSLTLPDSLSQFINSKNVGMALNLRRWISKTSALLRAQSKPFTLAISYMPTQACQTISQCLPSTKLNPFPMHDKMITSSAN